MPITDKGQKFRHEWKIEITPSDRIAIRQRMRAVARPDKHAKDGRYLIRSLYFDNANDKALRIVDGKIDWMANDSRELARELYAKMRAQGLRPKTILDYDREPFVYAPGNVRVTLDYNIRTGLNCTDFLNADCATVPAGDAPIILEVKWDDYLTTIIRDAVQLPGRRAGAFSKYAQCRIYM